MQAMYACIPEVGRGFFEGNCTPSDATALSHDPPHPVTRKDRNPVSGAPAKRRREITSKPSTYSPSKPAWGVASCSASSGQALIWITPL